MNSCARAARRTGHDGARVDECRDDARLARGAVNALRSGCDEEAHARMHASAAHHFRGQREILQRAVRARPDEGLIDRGAGHGSDRLRVFDDAVGEGDERLQVTEIDRAHLFVICVGIGVNAFKIGVRPRAYPLLHDIVRIENREVRGKLSRHGGQGLARADGEVRESGATVLDVRVGMVAVFAGDLQKGILHRHAAGQFARQLVAYRFADDEPRLAKCRRIHDVGHTDSARQAIKNARAPGVGVTAHQKRSRQRVCIVRHQLMADALIVTDVVKTLDAELLDECTGGLVRCRTLLVRGGRPMVDHDDHALGMVQPRDLAPAPGYEHRIDEHYGVHSHGNQVAGAHFCLAGFAGEYFFRQRHAHRGFRIFAVCRALTSFPSPPPGSRVRDEGERRARRAKSDGPPVPQSSTIGITTHTAKQSDCIAFVPARAPRRSSGGRTARSGHHDRRSG